MLSFRLKINIQYYSCRETSHFSGHFITSCYILKIHYDGFRYSDMRFRLSTSQGPPARYPFFHFRCPFFLFPLPIFTIYFWCIKWEIGKASGLVFPILILGTNIEENKSIWPNIEKICSFRFLFYFEKWMVHGFYCYTRVAIYAYGYNQPRVCGEV